MVEEAQVARLVDRSLTVVGKVHSPDGRARPRTMKGYRRMQRAYDKWAPKNGFPVMPTTSEALATYAGYLLQRGYAKSTIRGCIAAIKSKHRERGESVPDDVAAWSVLRGAHPTPADMAKVNTPVVRRAALVAVAAVCDLERPVGVRDLCLVTMAWELLDAGPLLVGLDFPAVTAADGGLLVRLPAGTLTLLHDHAPVELCAACAYQRWQQVVAAAGGAADGPVFRSIDKGGNIAGCGPKGGPAGADGRLSVRGVERIWAKLVVAAGLPPMTPRALRLGAAAEDLAGGGSLMEVLHRGRWSPHSSGAVRRLVVLADAISGEGRTGE